MKNVILFILICATKQLSAQSYYQVSKNSIIISNNKLTREISVSNDSVYSASMTLQSGGASFISTSKEFSFSINNKVFDGFSGWKLVATQGINDANGGKGVKIILNSKSGLPPIRIELNYLMYPENPTIRKWINFNNIGDKDYKLENINIEDLASDFYAPNTFVYSNYARMKHIGKFIGDWDDACVVVHDQRQRKGMALGNEAPGVLKRTSYNTIDFKIEIGLTHVEQDFPFRKWLKKGESYETPKTFLTLYADKDNGFDVINDDVNEFVLKFMRPRIYQLKTKPTFVYNTWYPFRTFINDSLIYDVAKAAAKCGVQEFVIDDGWQVNIGASSSLKPWGGNYGDWVVDKVKFPNGLKSTFDYIKSLGMKPGLWISVGSANKNSKVFQDHPEWFVKNSSNQIGNLHTSTAADNDFYSACFGTEWTEYIKRTILRLVKDYGLAYAKLDLAILTSAYINDNAVSGCYAKDHPYHNDHQESFIVIYDRVLKLIDDLHDEAPDLFIDCTFETAGKLQLMDYAIAQHAEGNWLSNFEEPSPVGPLRVRQMAWWRTPSIPAGSLVIGNLAIDDKDFEFGLKSLIGTLPIVLGDPRTLSDEKKAVIKSWSDWMEDMQRKYDYMSYRKDLPGFGEPQDGSFDGWMRINFQTKKGGIFGIFRQGALENTRTVFLKDLSPDKTYIIREAPLGKEIQRATGKALIEKGFQVSFQKSYDGKIFEVDVAE
jgi:alpha-galactosidase